MSFLGARLSGTSAARSRRSARGVERNGAVGAVSRAARRERAGHDDPPRAPAASPCFFSIRAQASLSVTVRLNTGAPGRESGSAAK